jgi:hypothetical protein
VPFTDEPVQREQGGSLEKKCRVLLKVAALLAAGEEAGDDLTSMPSQREVITVLPGERHGGQHFERNTLPGKVALESKVGSHRTHGTP